MTADPKSIGANDAHGPDPVGEEVEHDAPPSGREDDSDPPQPDSSVIVLGYD